MNSLVSYIGLLMVECESENLRQLRLSYTPLF